jgi:hypothetical protein
LNLKFGLAAGAATAGAHGAEKQHGERQPDELHFQHDIAPAILPFVLVGRWNSSFGSKSRKIVA